MTQTKRSAGNGRNSRQGTFVRRLRIINLHANCDLDKDAMEMLKKFSAPESRLYNQVFNSFIGFDAKAQTYLVEAVALYYLGEASTYTGIPHVDALLDSLYKAVDKTLAAGE